MYVSPGNGSAVRMNANLLLIHAVAARAGHDGAARQDARARVLLETLTRAPSLVLAARTADPTRLGLLDARPRLEPPRPPLVRPAGGGGARLGVARTPRARGPRRARGAGRRGDRPLRPPPRLALPARRRQPVQLERAALRERRRGHRAARPPARRLPPPPAALHRRDPPAAPRHGVLEPRPGLRVPLLPRPARARAAQLRHARVREHRRVRPAVPRARAAGGDEAAAGPRPAARCARGSRACSPAPGRTRAT